MVTLDLDLTFVRPIKVSALGLKVSQWSSLFVGDGFFEHLLYDGMPNEVFRRPFGSLRFDLNIL